MVNGLAPRETPMHELARRVGSVFQNPKSQFFNLDTDSELAFGLEMRPSAGRDPPPCGAGRGNAASPGPAGKKHLFSVRWAKAASCLWLRLCHGPRTLCAGRADGQSGSGGHCPPSRPDLRFEAAGLHNRGGGASPVLLTDLIDRAFYLRSGVLERTFTGEQFRSLPDPEREALGLRTLTPAVCTLPAVESAGSEEGCLWRA